MVTSASRRRVCAAAALLGVAVAGCTAAPAEPSPPTAPGATTSTPPTAPTQAEATPSTGPDDPVDLSTFTIPECERLLPIETVRSEFAEDAEHYDLDAGVPLSERMPSEEANAAMAQAATERDCLWGLPESDVGFTIDVAIIPESAREEFIPSLTEGEFEEVPLGDARSFVHALDNDSGLWVTLYAFDGNAWVTYLGMGRSSTAAELTGIALANLQAANPGL